MPRFFSPLPSEVEMSRVNSAAERGGGAEAERGTRSVTAFERNFQMMTLESKGREVL